jgi:hypothetical protein
VALLGEAPPLIVAKIETRPAVDDFDAILDVVDAVMIARGDLGVELPYEEVPIIQKQLVRRALDRGIPTIVATQMLESMIEAPRPTRAEASDVANAVFDGADAIMLSAETAIGKFPILAAQAAIRIARLCEEKGAAHLAPGARDLPGTDVGALTHAAVALARAEDDVVGIACYTRTGWTARMLAALRPPVPVLAFTPNESVVAQLALVHGVSARSCADADVGAGGLRLLARLLSTDPAVSPGAAVVLVASTAAAGYRTERHRDVPTCRRNDRVAGTNTCSKRLIGSYTLIDYAPGPTRRSRRPRAQPQDVTVAFPRDRLVVITGLSGSGKSSLAFDTIYAEGQRRYVESLSAYARQFLGQMEKPDVDQIDGLSPAISIDQKGASRNPRSTVGTVTEIYDYLRLLFARIGVPHCPNGHPIERQSVQQIVDQVLALPEGTRLLVLGPLVKDRKTEGDRVFEAARRQGFVRCGSMARCTTSPTPRPSTATSATRSRSSSTATWSATPRHPTGHRLLPMGGQSIPRPAKRCPIPMLRAWPTRSRPRCASARASC